MSKRLSKWVSKRVSMNNNIIIIIMYIDIYNRQLITLYVLIFSSTVSSMLIKDLSFQSFDLYVYVSYVPCLLSFIIYVCIIYRFCNWLPGRWLGTLIKLNWTELHWIIIVVVVVYTDRGGGWNRQAAISPVTAVPNYHADSQNTKHSQRSVKVFVARYKI